MAKKPNDMSHHSTPKGQRPVAEQHKELHSGRDDEGRRNGQKPHEQPEPAVTEQPGRGNKSHKD